MRLRIGDIVRMDGDDYDRDDIGVVVSHARRRGWVVILWPDNGDVDEATAAGLLRDLDHPDSPCPRVVRAERRRWGRERIRRVWARFQRWHEDGQRGEVPSAR